MEKELLYLSIATIFIFVLLMVLLFYLIVRKAVENRVKKKINIEKNRVREQILYYLMNSENSIKLNPNNLVRKKAVEELLSKFTKILEGENEKKNLSKLADMYLTDLYKAGLQSRNWSKRMNALYHIEDFQIRALEKEVKELIKKQDATKDEMVHGLRIIAKFQNTSLFEELVTNHSYLSEYEYRSILYQTNIQTLDAFVQGFQKCQLALKNAILDILGIKKELKYCSFLESVFNRDSGEVRLRALKALSNIGYVKDIANYLPLCQSPIWQERMMFAKIIGTIREEEGLKCLINLLHDENWWVRSQAGKSIKNNPNGNKILKIVYETTADPFAKDMAWEWMNKGD